MWCWRGFLFELGVCFLLSVIGCRVSVVGCLFSVVCCLFSVVCCLFSVVGLKKLEK
jgi:hypothetical protein